MAEKLISSTYLWMQQRLHCSGDYGRAGDKHLDIILELIDKTGSHNVLDYGCGKGFLGEALRQRDIPCHDYDPAMPGKGHAEIADLVVCTDVMEHIEPEKLNAVLEHIFNMTDVALFVAISMRPAGKILADGRNAHLIIQSSEWWRVKFEIAKFRVKKVWPSKELEWLAFMRPVGK